MPRLDVDGEVIYEAPALDAGYWQVTRTAASTCVQSGTYPQAVPKTRGQRRPSNRPRRHMAPGAVTFCSRTSPEMGASASQKTELRSASEIESGVGTALAQARAFSAA